MSIRLLDAIQFASNAHKGQTRKVTGLPYIVHPFGVAMLLQLYGYSEEIIIAGLLHDTVEDTSITLKDVQDRYGVTVAGLVDSATNRISKEGRTWREYKQARIDKTKGLDINAKVVIAADKLDEIRSLVADEKVHGEKLWHVLELDKEDKEWYLREITKGLCSNKKEVEENLILQHLQLEVEDFFK